MCGGDVMVRGGVAVQGVWQSRWDIETRQMVVHRSWDEGRRECRRRKKAEG